MHHATNYGMEKCSMSRGVTSIEAVASSLFADVMNINQL